MKTSFLGLRTVVYKIPDLESAKKWYTQAFEIEPYFDEPFYVGFNIAGYELGLLPNETEGQTGETVIAYWGVDDIKSSYDRLLHLGASSHEAPLNVGGELEVAAVKDPWGNVIGIIYNPAFKLPTS
jgi:predicted enzyme related to lactoylglutathione lyase